MIIVHVEDLLISPNATDIELLRNAMKQFKTGPIFELEKEKQMEYLGLELQQSVRGVIGMHLMRYIIDLELVSIEDVIKNQLWVISKERWATLTKQLKVPILKRRQ